MMKDLEDGLCNRSVMSPAACRTKRVLDVMASVIGMAVFSPLFLIIYIAIKWEDGGKAIFRQERVGYHGETFTLYKFRSMIASSESDGRPALCSGADDRRLTRVGRFLREHHLDELPQLWNVLKGEMSCSTSCVPACSRPPRSTTATRTRWRRCSKGCAWTWTTCTTARCGSTRKSSS